MDDIDKLIIRLLQQNARISISDIASKISLSIPAVSERLKKLGRSGVIEKYTAILNAEKVGRDLLTLMFISLCGPDYTEVFSEFVQHETEITECFYIAGDFDYALKIITLNTSSLENLLNRIKKVPGVIRTKTIVTLSTVKNNYSIQV